jgi:hypothetical protein
MSLHANALVMMQEALKIASCLSCACGHMLGMDAPDGAAVSVVLGAVVPVAVTLGLHSAPASINALSLSIAASPYRQGEAILANNREVRTGQRQAQTAALKTW